MTLRTIYANLADGLQPFSLWDASLADMGNLGTIPCTAVGTNSIVLTPIAAAFSPAVTIPQALQEFAFVAAASSSGAITIQIGTTAALKLYRMDGVTQAATGDLVATVTYVINYNAALNGAVGGFQILAPIANEINPIISGATITGSTITTSTYNGNIWTAGTGTLTIAAGKTETFNNTLTFAGVDGKTLTVNNSLIFAGTDATTMTFPTTTATIARTDAGQTFTGNQAISGTFAVTSVNASAFAVGLNGATNSVLQVDASTGSQVSGLKITGAVTGGTPTIQAIDSGSNTSIQISPKGTGAVILGGIANATINLNASSGTTTINLGAAGVSGAILTIAGSSSGSMQIVSPAAASGTLNLAPGTLTGSSATAVWYDNIPQNSQSAAYGLVLADAQKHILHPSADTTARIWTIPANGSVAYPIGTAVTFVNQNAGGVITIAITTDTMRLAGSGTTGSRSLAANGIATALKITSTEWIISGTGLT